MNELNKRLMSIGLLGADEVQAQPPGLLSEVGGKGPTIYNNPGNVEKNQKWAGTTGKYYGKKGRFPVFDSPQMGIRALMRDLNSKIKEFNGNLKSIINKYAPKNENDTNSYFEFVSNDIGKTQVSNNDIKELAASIIKYENKPDIVSYYLSDPSIIEEAYQLSKIKMPQNTSFKEAKKAAEMAKLTPPNRPMAVTSRIRNLRAK